MKMYVIQHRFWAMRGAIILCAQIILHRWRQMVAVSELLALFTATQLRIHNLENKILIRYNIVWLSVLIF